MDVTQLADRYYTQQTALARQIAGEAARLWRLLNPASLDASWYLISGELLALVSGSQILAASAADGYTDAVLVAQDINPAASGQVYPLAFGRTASDGRPLDTLLREPLIGVKAAIGSGATATDALAGGLLAMDMIVRTQIADAGRGSVGTAIAARRNVTGYVRMLSPPSCSRCAVLAGRWYRWNAGFARHP